MGLHCLSRHLFKNWWSITITCISLLFAKKDFGQWFPTYHKVMLGIAPNEPHHEKTCLCGF